MSKIAAYKWKKKESKFPVKFHYFLQYEKLHHFISDLKQINIFSQLIIIIY